MAVADIEVDRIAALLAEERHVGLARPGGGERPGPGRGVGFARHAARQAAFMPFDPAGAQLGRGFGAHEGAPRRRMVRAQQRVQGHVDEVGVAVECLAVSERKLDAFDEGMDELGAIGVHGRDVVALEQGERLEKYGALAPGAGLGEGVAVVVAGDGGFEARLPGGHVVGGDEARMAPAAAVEGFGAAGEAIDPLGHEAAVESVPRRFDLPLAVAARGFGLRHDAGVGVAEGGVGE